MNREQISRRCRLARVRRGFSVKEVFELTRIAQRTIRAYENGDRLPGLWALIELAKVYRVPVGWLMGEDQQEEQGGLSFRVIRHGNSGKVGILRQPICRKFLRVCLVAEKARSEPVGTEQVAVAPLVG